MGEDSRGKKVFVENAIVGDIVRAKVYKDKKSFAFASMEEVLAPSPERLESPCPIFPICGGCTYLCTSYDNELKIKQEIVMEQLCRIGGMTENHVPEMEIMHSDRFAYRSHSTLKSHHGKTGFFKRRSNEIVPLPEKTCLLLSEEIGEFIKSLTPGQGKREIKIARDYRGNVQCSLSREDNMEILEKNGGMEYRHGIWNFFQANMKLRDRMLSKVKEYCDLNETSNFIDIGSGCGFFTLLLAKNSNLGIGCEIDRESVKYARQNAGINGISNVKFLAIPFEKFHPGREPMDCIVADPPRAGLHKKSRQTINFIKPKKLVYVSCNPATFARDSADFIKGGYKLVKLSMMDMFPGTHHIEVIGKFMRK